ncbi:MAG: ribonuclease D [Rhodospirillales bacterium]|nr:ribonuclease D [Alphaproteobacteria bacterium]USO04463.1 MAG: ribonuclease D [Rhodospirillales bacterium]
MIIQTQDDLEDFCAALARGPYLTIDTEFLRDKTYYSKLCLIQMAGPDVEARALDMIGTTLDWTPVYDLLVNENVLKVFHAARQDLEIFYQINGKIPHPIFDTQVAAMVCGYGDSISYSALVQDITGHPLEKSAQFTDWSRRPLSQKQLTYALNDVTYLREVYEKLHDTLRKKGRESWVNAEMTILTTPETYDSHPENAWERIKIRSDKPEVFAILKELAAWREATAQKKDVPRGRILKDETLADLALYKPKDMEGLLRVRSLPKPVAKGETGEKLVKLIKKAVQSPKDTWPRRENSRPFPKTARSTLEMLKMLLKINTGEADVTPKIIASAQDMERLAAEDAPDIPALKGWRHEIFGKDALRMKAGKLALTLQDGEIRLIELEEN